MDTKEDYGRFCTETTPIPIFHFDWWLDATAGPSNWEVATVDRGNQVIAAMPYTITKIDGHTIIGQPRATQYLGPWISPLSGSHATILSAQKKIMNALIDQLPSFDHFAQSWHHSLQNWLPFYWRGFSQTTRYTYTITLDNTVDPMSLFASNMRNKVRKANRLVEVMDNLDPNSFYRTCKKTFFRQEKSIPFSFDQLNRLDTELTSRNRRKIFAAIDADGNIHSALYLIWDNRASYVHMVGEDPSFRNSGAGILLIEAAIRFSVEIGLQTFDFEGSMLENIEIVRRSCGGHQTPYFHISKTPSRMLRARQLVSLLVKGQ